MSNRSSITIACAAGLAMTIVAAAQDTEPIPGDKFPLPDKPAFTPEGQAAAAITGSIAVHAIQGTPDGPVIGGVAVEVNLVHSGMVIRTVNGELDEHGVAVFEDLPIGMGVTPIVRITYGEVLYQQPGAMMDATNRQQKIEVTCYEVTEEPVPWRISMRHVMVDHAEGGLTVAEVIVVENTSGRTWVGAENESGRRVTCVFPVPDAAQQIALGDGFFDRSYVSLEKGRLISHLPLMPETTRLNFRYFIPADEDGATIHVRTETATDQMMVVIPDELNEETVKGIEYGGTDSFGQQQVRYYRASGVAPGDSAEFVLSGLAANATETGANGGNTRMIVAVGAGVLLLAAIGILLRRRPGEPTTTA